MYLWFMCIFISYKTILLNKERESENSDSSIHCTLPLVAATISNISYSAF